MYNNLNNWKQVLIIVHTLHTHFKNLNSITFVIMVENTNWGDVTGGGELGSHPVYPTGSGRRSLSDIMLYTYIYMHTAHIGTVHLHDHHLHRHSDIFYIRHVARVCVPCAAAFPSCSVERRVCPLETYNFLQRVCVCVCVYTIRAASSLWTKMAHYIISNNKK